MPEDERHFDPAATPEREVAAEATEDQSTFIGLMGHFYRGELGRTTSWRRRLDRTTNWAIIVTATLLTWAFSAKGRPHSILLIGMVTVMFFLFVEARRYRMYDVWRSRVRLLEENVLAGALDRGGVAHAKWRELLSADLHVPRVKMPLREAVARRLRRIYLVILGVLLVAWVARITWLAPLGVTVWQEASIAIVPGKYVIAAVASVYGLLVLLAIWPMKRRAKGELRTDDLAGEWKNGPP